jgi:hypothetical protein
MEKIGGARQSPAKEAWFRFSVIPRKRLDRSGFSRRRITFAADRYNLRFRKFFRFHTHEKYEGGVPQRLRFQMILRAVNQIAS